MKFALALLTAVAAEPYVGETFTTTSETTEVTYNTGDDVPLHYTSDGQVVTDEYNRVRTVTTTEHVHLVDDPEP